MTFNDDFFKDFDRDFDKSFKQTKRLVGAWFLFVALVVLAVLGGLAALTVILLNHFNVV